MIPPMICIVGKIKTSRVRLMEGLIRELRTRGFRVGVLKHHKHGDFEIDIEGKDSWKYTKAGADTVAISSPLKFAVIKNVKSEINIDEILETCFQDMDIVLADGFALSDKPRIIIVESEEDRVIFEMGRDVVAVAGRQDMNDPAGIAERILEFSGI